MSQSNATDKNHNDTFADSSTNKDESTPVPSPEELTRFQIDALTIIAAEKRIGTEINDELSEYYDKDVNHGQLYPNLDTLVEKGLVDKTPRDRRSHFYAITELGKEVLHARWDRLTTHLQVAYEDEFEGGEDE